DVKDVELKQKNGSYKKMKRTDIELDNRDSRTGGRRRLMFYKFWLHVSSTDVQVSIQSFHTRNRTHKMRVDQKQISMTDKGEFESAALPQEYSNLPAGIDISSSSSSSNPNAGHHHSNQLFSKVSSRARPPSRATSGFGKVYWIVAL